MTADRLGLSLENDRLRRTDLRRQSWLTFLAEASELLAQSLDVELTLALIPRLLVPRLGQWAAVYSVDEWTDPVYAAAAHTDETALARAAGRAQPGRYRGRGRPGSVRPCAPASRRRCPPRSRASPCR